MAQLVSPAVTFSTLISDWSGSSKSFISTSCFVIIPLLNMGGTLYNKKYLKGPKTFIKNEKIP